MPNSQSINRILIVDDLEANRFTLRLMLETLESLAVFDQLEIVEAENGRDALDKLNAQSFDLVLLDVMMPVMSGIDLLEAYIDPESLNQPPIVMVSALSETDTVAKAISLGAIDYLTKPINRRLLVARVTSALKHRHLVEEISVHRTRMEKELLDAAQIQLGLCPTVFPDNGVQVAGILRPALEIGGDFYDAFSLSDGSSLMVIGDVCDKGVPAALFTMRVRDIIRTASQQMTWDSHPESVKDLMTTANEIISDVNPGQIFVATCIIHAHPTTGELRICNAGVPAPLIHRASGIERATQRERGQPTIGLVPGLEYRMDTSTLGMDDSLFMFTDGIEDLEDEQGVMLAEQGLVEHFEQEDRSQSANERIEGLKRMLDEFRGSANQVDDVTLIALKRV